MCRANGAHCPSTATQIGYLHYSLTAAELNDYIDSYHGRIDQVVAYFASYSEGLKELDLQIDTTGSPGKYFGVIWTPLLAVITLGDYISDSNSA